MSQNVLKPAVRNVRDVGKKNTYFQVYVGRPTMWSNPYQIDIDGTREEVIELYRKFLIEMLEKDPEFLDDLKGKDLVCWCAPLACHADILLEYANRD